MSWVNGKRIDDFAEAKKSTELDYAPTHPTLQLKALIKAGRKFLLSLEDAELTTNEETGVELNDIIEFRAALDRAAKAVKS